MIYLAKFRFKSKKGKNKFNFITDNSEILNNETIKGTHIELFLNQKMILDGCVCIIDYQDSYIKLRLKKGSISILGTNFSITNFENERITINGNILSIEFCI